MPEDNCFQNSRCLFFFHFVQPFASRVLEIALEICIVGYVLLGLFIGENSVAEVAQMKMNVPNIVKELTVFNTTIQHYTSKSYEGIAVE